MRNFMVMFILLLLLFSIVGIEVQPALASGNFIVAQVVWGTPSNPVSVGPNVGNQILTVVLQYLGFGQVTGIRSYIELPAGFTNTTGGNQTWAYAQSASPGSLVTLQYTINIGNVSLGTYYANLYVMYSSTTESYQIRFDVKGIVEFEANSSFFELVPGVINNVSLTLINKGTGNASSVSVTVLSPQQVGLIGNQVFKLGNIPSGKSVSFNVSLYVPASLSGSSIPLTLQTSYIDPYGYSKISTQTVYFLVLLPQPTSLVLSLYPYQITSGTENTLIFNITNTGSTAVKYLTITFASSQLTFTNFDGKWYVGTLDSGMTKSINVTVYTSASSGGVAQITGSLSYVDASGISRTETRTLGVMLLQQTLTTFVISTAPQQLISNKENVLMINLTNTGSTMMYGVTLTFTPPSQMVFEGFDGKWYVGDVKPKETKTLIIKTYVTSPSSVVLQLPVAVSFTDSSGVLRNENRIIGFTILTSTRAFNTHLSIEPQQLIGGKSNDLTLFITNVGGSLLRNVSMTISPSSQIALIGFDGKWYIGTLKFNETKVLRFTVYPSTAQSTYLAQINVVVNYIDSSGVLTSENIPLSIIVMPNTGIVNPLISISTRTLKAGSINNLTLTVVNNNTYAMKSVSLSISFSGTSIPTLLSLNNIFINIIKAGYEISIPVSIYVPASSGDTTNMIVTINYYNEEGTFMQYSQPLGLLVIVPSDLRVTNYVVLPQPIVLGQPFSITLTLTNVGMGTAYNVYASIMNNRYFIPVTGNQVYVGNLQSGSSSTITFSFMSTNVTTRANFTPTFTSPINRTILRLGNFTMSIVLTYQDNLRNVHTLNITIPLRVSSSTIGETQTARATQNNLGLFNYTNLLIISIIIVVVVIIVMTIRRRRHEIK